MKAHLAWLTWLLPNKAFLEAFALRVSTNTILCMNKLHFHHIWIFSFLSLSLECLPSGNDNLAIYLNTGLTSTQNYGKTILTKASEVQTDVLDVIIW